MKIKTFLASLALAGFVIAQPVSAATRSIDTLDNAERIGSLDGESEALGSSPILWIVLLAILIGGGVALASDGDPESP